MRYGAERFSEYKIHTCTDLSQRLVVGVVVVVVFFPEASKVAHKWYTTVIGGKVMQRYAPVIGVK